MTRRARRAVSRSPACRLCAAPCPCSAWTGAARTPTRTRDVRRDRSGRSSTDTATACDVPPLVPSRSSRARDATALRTRRRVSSAYVRSTSLTPRKSATGSANSLASVSRSNKPTSYSSSNIESIEAWRRPGFARPAITRRTT